MKTVDFSSKAASNRANAVQRATSKPGAQYKETVQCKVQQWIDGSPRQASHGSRQPLPGAVKQLKAAGSAHAGLVAQRTVDTAAAAFFKQGVVEIKKRDLSAKFCKEHAIAPGDLADVQAGLTALRQNEKAAMKPKEVIDMRDKKNWQVGQIGMIEGDATAIAEKQGWDCVANNFVCSDSAHSPKGKLYLGQDGVYYGADNTGHVGWGFKVWTKKDKTTLTYKGNIIWNGEAWEHKPRGTK